MFGFLKFLFLCALAIAAGVAAVSVPVAGKTVAAHVQAFVADSLGEGPGEQAPAQRKSTRPAAKQSVAPAPAGSRAAARQAPTAKPRQEESVPTPAERAALENLIGSRTAKPPAPGR